MAARLAPQLVENDDAMAVAAAAAAVAVAAAGEQPMPLPDAVMDAVVAAYEALRTGCKPREREWTVVAGIVAYEPAAASAPPPHSRPALTVVSLGAGTKCIGQGDQVGDGSLVQDCHAEVLARRAFKRLLLEEMRAHAHHCRPHVAPQLPAAAAAAAAAGGGGDATVDAVVAAASDAPRPRAIACRCIGVLAHDSGVTRFALRDGVSLHLYVSDSPCGAACEYDDSSGGIGGDDGGGGGGGGGGGCRHTGAKAVGTVAAGPAPLCTKPGRTDLPAHKRTRSMSCSDKLCQWMLCGIQGRLAARYCSAAIPLASLTVSADATALAASADGGGSGTAPTIDVSRQAAALSSLLQGRYAAVAAALPPSAGRLLPPPLALSAVVPRCAPTSRAAATARLLAAGGAGLGGAAGSKRRREDAGDVSAAAGAAGSISGGAVVPTLVAAGIIGGNGTRAMVVPSGTALGAYRVVPLWRCPPPPPPPPPPAAVDDGGASPAPPPIPPPPPRVCKASAWVIEALNGSAGTRLGATSVTSAAARRSGLCKAAMAEAAMATAAAVGGTLHAAAPTTYAALKAPHDGAGDAAPALAPALQSLHRWLDDDPASPLAGWLHASRGMDTFPVVPA